MFCLSVTSSGGNCGALGRRQRFLLRHVELRGRTAVELLFDEIEDALGCCQVLAGDAQLVLRGENLEIGIGDGDHRRQCDNLAIISRDRRVFLRRIERRAILAPEVEHVARGQSGLESIEGRPAEAVAAGDGIGAALLLSFGARISRQRREQGRARHPDQGIGLDDLGDGHGDIEVVKLGRLHQRGELGGTEAAPPVQGRNGGVRIALACRAIGLGHFKIEFGAFRAEDAARERRAHRKRKQRASRAAPGAGARNIDPDTAPDSLEKREWTSAWHLFARLQRRPGRMRC